MTTWKKRVYGDLQTYRKHKVGEVGVANTWDQKKKKYVATVAIYKSDGTLSGKVKSKRMKTFSSKTAAVNYAQKYMNTH